MAETHDNQYKTLNRKEVFNKDYDDENENDNDEDVNVNKQNLETSEDNKYNNYQSITSFGDEPVDDLLSLANDDTTAIETANLLLSEHQPNFVDFDEFNICLNNILNDDVDSQLQLSPSVVISNTLTTDEVDELFKVNIDMKSKNINHMSPTTTTTSTLNDIKNISSFNTNTSSCSSICNNSNSISISNSSSSSSSSNSKSSLRNKQILQLLNHQHNNDDNENEDDHDNDLLNMVHFDDHMDFTFSSELVSNNNISNTTTTTTSPYLTSSMNNNNDTTKYKKNIISTRHSLSSSTSPPSHGHNYAIAIDKKNTTHNNVVCVDDVDNVDVNLDLNMMVDPMCIQQQTICNSTATVSASLTTTATTSNIRHNDEHDDNDDDNDNNDTPQETALNNVIKRNNHSIVNIFQ